MSRFLRTVLLFLLLATAASAHAANYVLSGGPAPGDTLGNDDELYVYVNNIEVGYRDCCDGSPVSFSANPGDTLRVTVNDSGGGCISLEPLFLHSGGGFTVLDPVGQPQECPNVSAPGDPWYDRTFTVPAPHSIPTLSEWGMILLSGLLAFGAVFALRRQRQ